MKIGAPHFVDSDFAEVVFVSEEPGRSGSPLRMRGSRVGFACACSTCCMFRNAVAALAAISGVEAPRKVSSRGSVENMPRNREGRPHLRVKAAARLNVLIQPVFPDIPVLTKRHHLDFGQAKLRRPRASIRRGLTLGAQGSRLGRIKPRGVCRSYYPRSRSTQIKF